jgi:hypothetical protein
MGWHDYLGITYGAKKHGLSRVVISNQGPGFVSQFMRDLMKLLGIQGNPSMAYHPQTDRQTEWINQEIEQYLKIHVNYQQDDQAEWLTLAEFAYNDQEHSAMKCSPFYANYGQHPNKGTSQNICIKSLSAIELAQQMRNIHDKVGAAIAHTQ